MIVLGIESATSRGGVAIINDDKLLGSVDFESVNTHGREIAPAIKKLCAENNFKISNIDLIVCDLGPGSYTGLRVGLAHAKGISFAIKKPLIGVCSLEIMMKKALGAGFSKTCPMIDAKWGEIYFAIYENGELIHQPDHKKAEIIASLAPADTFFLGDALDTYQDHFQIRKKLDKEYWFPSAKIVAECGLEKYNNGYKDDIYSIEPLYLRKTEAEIKEERGNERSQSLG